LPFGWVILSGKYSTSKSNNSVLLWKGLDEELGPSEATGKQRILIYVQC